MQSSTGTEVSAAGDDRRSAWNEERVEKLLGSRFARRWCTATVRRMGQRYRGPCAAAIGTRAEVDAGELVEKISPVEHRAQGRG